MLKTKIVKKRLRDLGLLGADAAHENARYMPKPEFDRLVQNIKNDGVLSSAPLIGRLNDDPEKLYVVSGNHRVEAALAAGIEEAHCIEIQEPMERQRFIALQLSHNAIAGKDDPVVLKRLYERLDIEYKEYSGLTDDLFDIDDLDVTTVSGIAPLYIEVILSFLSDDANAVTEFLKRSEQWAKKSAPHLVARYADFNRFFDLIVRTKDLKGITNSAVAMGALIELAAKQLETLESGKERKAVSGKNKAA